ncbi:MAG: DUF4968 domain-containing protein [bacterium]|nr:DUF4968 domain-containing protein [bacterium]
MKISSKLLNFEKNDNYYYLKTNGPDIKLCFMTDDIIRIRASFDKKFKEESYALSLTAWEDRFDSLLGNLRKRVTPINVEEKELDDCYELSTATCKLIIQKEPFGIKLISNDGIDIYSDLFGRAFKEDRQGRVYHYNEIDQENDCFYGFGETSGVINKRKRRIRQAPRDSIGYDAELTNPMYKHIPFYIRINKKQKHAAGLFYNNTYESLFDLGCEKSGYWPRYSYFCADGGDIDLFLINGPKISNVVERYTDLTGKTAFCPMHALGYLGSTMYYVELPKNCDDGIVAFIDKNIKENIPIDNFHLSSGYTVDEENGKRNVFTWNKKRFKEPKKFFQEMAERGVSVSPNVKPGVLTVNPNYKKFSAGKVFIRDAENNEAYVDQWWGGPGSFVDFTNPAGRDVWKNLLKKQVIEMGTASIWNDNCEYDSIDDRSAVCDFDGEGGIVDELKPVQSLLMAHVAREAIHEAKPGIRPYIINRSGYAGIQKYSSTWAGDNFTSWKTLKYNIATILGMGLSGVANNGCDIGGFWGACPDAELLVRWIQNGIFQPRFSIHSCNTDNTVTQPWMYSDYAELIRDTIKFRYQLMPYFYSLLYEAHTKGTPIARPLFYEFQNDVNTYSESCNFMLGNSMLIANVVEEGADTKSVYLPKGSDWYYWYNRQKFTGGQIVELNVDITTIPLFIRDSAILPMTENFTGVNKDVIDNLNIIIGGKDSSFTIFEDDKKTYKYLDGDCLKTDIKVKSGCQVTIDFNKQGRFKSKVNEIILDVINKGKGPFWVSVDGKRIQSFLNRDEWEISDEGWYYSASKGSAMVKYQNMEGSYQVIVSFEHFDLIGM